MAADFIYTFSCIGIAVHESCTSIHTTNWALTAKHTHMLTFMLGAHCWASQWVVTAEYAQMLTFMMGTYC